MMGRQVRSCGVTLLLVLGGLVVPAPASAQMGYRPCSLVSVGETEALAGEKVVKSVESTVPRTKGNGYGSEIVNSVCQRWLSAGRMFFLTLGVPVTDEAKVEVADGVLSRESQEKIREMGGTWESKQFGEITCLTVVVPSTRGFDTTTCAAVKIPLFYGDGFDRTASIVKEPLRFTLQITAGPKGLVPVDVVHALAEKVLARMP
jgi:hypothetical protein